AVAGSLDRRHRHCQARDLTSQIGVVGGSGPRGDLLHREVRAGHADAHRVLVDLALDLDGLAVLAAAKRARELVALPAVGLEHPVSAFEVAAADRAFELHAETIAASGASGTGGARNLVSAGNLRRGMGSARSIST